MCGVCFHGLVIDIKNLWKYIPIKHQDSLQNNPHFEVVPWQSFRLLELRGKQHSSTLKSRPRVSCDESHRAANVKHPSSETQFSLRQTEIIICTFIKEVKVSVDKTQCTALSRCWLSLSLFFTIIINPSATDLLPKAHYICCSASLLSACLFSAPFRGRW